MLSSPAVIILAAGSIKEKYKTYSFAFNSPALVPIASRSTLSFIISFYQQRDLPIYIAVNDADYELFEKELGYYRGINIIRISSSLGVCDTLEQVVAIVDETEVIVNLGTTIPTVFCGEQTVLFDGKLSAHGNYSGVYYNNDGQLGLKKKSQKEPLQFHAFTGTFRCKSLLLEEALTYCKEKADLINPVIYLLEKNLLQIEMCDWIDTGHEINYAKARKKLISSRSFNAISVDDHTGVLKKKSENIAKLNDEVSYVKMLPEYLQILYPRIIRAEQETGSVWMEYYGYPNLSEYQLYRDINPLQWSRIFDGLYFCLNAMANRRFSIGLRAFESFYYEKNCRRVEEYLESLEKDDVLVTASEIIVNNLPCGNFTQIRDKIKSRIINLYNEDDFCVMHGDFCFNNILYDPGSDTIKLIDPRGSFGDQCVGIYGDKKYDLAKLAHSTIGQYDYIVNHLFHLETLKNTISYSFPLRKNAETLESLTDEIFYRAKAKKEDILFIVGLLFLSMCPLHRDSPQRQRMMYAHGLYFVNKYL